MPSNNLESLTEIELEQLLNRQKLPRHIAIVMDGNGRWAEKRDLPRIEGHKAAIEAIRDVVESCGKLEIEALTLYAFSTENWKRPIREVNALMLLLRQQLKEQTEELNENNVRLRAIGQLNRIPKRVRQELERSINITQNNTGLILNLALNYGSRQEIVQATQRIAQAVKEGELKINDINENLFANYLYTADLPELDLLIRPSGEMRVSNFLLWQLAYAELYVTPTFWPDFRKKDLLLALIAYQQRKRRFGGLNDQFQ
ncbi:isoprenyl transferase [Candidatus Poribacteria bacterium]|nr:isoprenyl transferase [Candidatus Poribacteria bacterium]